MLRPDTMTRWTVDQSADLYNIRNWGAGYFDISGEGDLEVRPGGRASPRGIRLPDLVEGLKERGVDMPVLLRFSEILDDRIRLLNESFSRAIQEAGYHGTYRGVYPIKVNQQQQVVHEVTRRGRRFHHGLEAGSKAELIVALTWLDDPEALVVCNGYKDEEFVDLALYAQKMGMRTFLVVETPDELPLILSRAERMGIHPRIGLRYKISVRGSGHWTESGGDRSMFGLTAAQVIDMVDQLRARGMLDGLQMLHYHVGSQLPNIRHIQAGIREASRVYVDLVREGARMGCLNVGGGLAVDYDGSHTNFSSSSNYSLDEYAADIVEAVMKSTDAGEVEHPTIVSESGRAILAHHAVLLFNVLGVTSFSTEAMPDPPAADAPESLRNLYEIPGLLTARNVQECYHDALFYRDEIRTLFEHGMVDLRSRAGAERAFWYIMTRLSAEARKLKYIPEELAGIETALADVYHGNFSVFQSLPDVWAIDQLFPVMPIHRLNEYPSRQATIADITCDCDGKISRFVDLQDVRSTLRLHPLRTGEDYHLGVFLVGAYQETLGDLHNLFGDTNVVSVGLDENGDISFDNEVEGDTVADVLSYVEYNPQDMIERFRLRAEAAVRTGCLSPRERRDILSAYQAGMRGYTYFEQ